MRRELIAWILIAAGCWTALHLMGFELAVALIGEAVIAAGLLRRLLSTTVQAATVADSAPLAPGPSTARVMADPGTLGVAEWSGTFDTAGLTWWERRLNWVDGDPQAFNTTIHPRLVALVDERLRLKHGISRADNPDRACQTTGVDLWNLLGEPPAIAPTPRQLAAIITQMERL